MKEILNELRGKDYDAYFFYAGDEDGKVMIQSSTYKETGTKIGGNEIGDCYHIVLFRMDEEGKTKDLEKFEAILASPADYMSMLIPNDWYGGIYKKTHNSHEMAQDLFDRLSEAC